MTKLLQDLDALLEHVSHPDIRGPLMQIVSDLEAGRTQIQRYREQGGSEAQIQKAEKHLAMQAADAGVLVSELVDWVIEASPKQTKKISLTLVGRGLDGVEVRFDGDT